MQSETEKNSDPVRIAVLGSGSGTNFQAILDAIDKGELDAKVVCVLSDVEDAFILERARQHDIPAYFISAASFKTKLEGEAEEAYLDVLARHDTELIALAGFMRIVKQGLLEAYAGRMLNIHPSLLPAFPGLHSWKQAVDYGVKVSGCTVHIVDAGTDTGPILIQRTVPVLPDDTADTLHARIQVEEHKAYPEALQLVGARIRTGEV